MPATKTKRAKNKIAKGVAVQVNVGGPWYADLIAQAKAGDYSAQKYVNIILRDALALLAAGKIKLPPKPEWGDVRHKPGVHAYLKGDWVTEFVRVAKANEFGVNTLACAPVGLMVETKA